MKRLSFGTDVTLGSIAFATALLLSLARPAAADMIGNCQLTGEKGSIPMTPIVSGQLTVEVNLPARGWWNSGTPDSIKDGCLVRR